MWLGNAVTSSTLLADPPSKETINVFYIKKLIKGVFYQGINQSEHEAEKTSNVVLIISEVSLISQGIESEIFKWLRL